MMYFVLLTFFIFASYLLGFIKKLGNTSGWTEIAQHQLRTSGKKSVGCIAGSK